MIPERAGRSLRERIRSTLRDYRSVVAPLIVLIVGLGIALASLTPDTEAVYQPSFSGTSEPYNITVYAFSIGTPYGWLALPGSAIALTGLILFVPRVVLQKTLKLRDEFELKKPK